jgi:hypothetical protein
MARSIVLGYVTRAVDGEELPAHRTDDVVTVRMAGRAMPSDMALRCMFELSHRRIDVAKSILIGVLPFAGPGVEPRARSSAGGMLGAL